MDLSSVLIKCWCNLVYQKLLMIFYFNFNLIRFVPCAQMSQLASRIKFLIKIKFLNWFLTCAIQSFIKTTSKIPTLRFLPCARYVLLLFLFIFFFFCFFLFPCAYPTLRQEPFHYFYFSFKFSFSLFLALPSFLAPCILFQFPCATSFLAPGTVQFFFIFFYSFSFLLPPCATKLMHIYTLFFFKKFIFIAIFVPLTNCCHFFYLKSSRNSAHF